MKKYFSLLLALVMLIPLVVPQPASAAPASLIPTISIVSVVADKTVTIRTHNYPANDRFDVLMGNIGTRGVGGIRVDTINSGSGGSFTATFSIPAALVGKRQIAIRLQSVTGSGYFSYNWFYNNTSGSGTGSPVNPSPGYTGFPTFSITGVDRNKTVTVKVKNLPANDSFDVLMGAMGTRGIGGYYVTTVNTVAGGGAIYTFNIPAALKGSYQIAIRMQSPTSGYFAYNWFYNNTTGGGTGSPVNPNPPGYTGFPVFYITSVVRNASVTIQTNNLPANDTFNVLMGPMGTSGVGGYFVTSVNSGSGGTQNFTFDIPAALKGSYQIAIRMQSPTSGYFAYNWFYNNTTP